MPGAAALQRGGVGPDGKGQEDEDEDGERHDLPQGDPGPRLDPQVLAGHENCVMPHGTPPWLPVAAAESAAGTAVRAGRRPPASSPVTRPPVMATTRSASGTASCGSCDDSSTRRAVGDRLADQLAEEGAGGGVEAGVRLIEQPERGAAGHQRGQCHPASLSGRESTSRRWCAAGRSGRAVRARCRPP